MGRDSALNSYYLFDVYCNCLCGLDPSVAVLPANMPTTQLLPSTASDSPSQDPLEANGPSTSNNNNINNNNSNNNINNNTNPPSSSLSSDDLDYESFNHLDDMGSASMLCSVSSVHANSALHHEHEFPHSSDSANLHRQALSLLEDSYNQRSFNLLSSTCNYFDTDGILLDNTMPFDNPLSSMSPSTAVLASSCMFPGSLLPDNIVPSMSHCSVQSAKSDSCSHSLTSHTDSDMSQDDAFVNNLLPSASRLSAPPTALLTYMSLTTASSTVQPSDDNDVDFNSDKDVSTQVRKHSKSKHRRSYLTASQKHSRKNRLRIQKRSNKSESLDN